MCGIAGMMRWDGAAPDPLTVQSMCDAMVHRGPDDQGLYADTNVALGMRRLSIIDLESGHQPVHNEDKTLWIVFNGEIYNFKELRRDLEAKGHKFYTSSDTETIVHLHEEYGDAAVEHLRGMFAYALWDTKRRRLLIARDRLGIKPLYYAPFAGGVAFGSELKTVLEVPQIDRKINWQSLGHLFTFRATPADESIIEGVHKLEPGHRVVFTADGRSNVQRYWDLKFEPDYNATEDQLVERLRAILTEAVDIHRRSDVPLGVFLSGGLDSSAVLATLAPMTSGRVRTFSIGFAEAGFDELPHARQVAKAFGAEHHELVLQPYGWDTFEKLAGYLDEPFGDAAALPQYMVSKLAAEHVKVVLSGDGGDEIFGGYDKYVVEERERRYDNIPAPLRRVLGAIGRTMPEGMKGRNFLRHIALDGVERYIDSSVLFGRTEQASLLRPEVRAQVRAGDPWAIALAQFARSNRQGLSALQYWDLQCYLPLEILTKVDRMTMAHSIEARPVLLDHKLVEFAATVPQEYLLRNGTTKYIFKRAMRGILPDSIIDRKKHGFAVPWAHWFRGDLAGFIREVLLSDRSRQRGILDPAYLTRLLELHERGRSLDDHLWTLVSFELWCRANLDRQPASAAIAERSARVSTGNVTCLTLGNSTASN